MRRQIGRSCPRCKVGLLIVRRGKHGLFFGCGQYPDCRYTRSLGKEESWVSASEIASTEFCPQSFYLKTMGTGMTQRAKEQIERGNLAHAQVSADKRCYIATYALGEDHEIVQQLREWRDHVLKISWYGRAIIRTYYFLSPIVIKVFGRSALFRLVARMMVRSVAKWIRGV